MGHPIVHLISYINPMIYILLIITIYMFKPNFAITDRGQPGCERTPEVFSFKALGFCGRRDNYA